eukprot:15331274-Ditylum_brightwellii.AAC.1
MSEAAQQTVNITDNGNDSVHDPGKMDIMPKTHHHISPIPKPCNYGDTLHCNNVHGISTAIGGNQYTLWGNS